MKQWILQKIDGKLKPLPGQNPTEQEQASISSVKSNAKQQSPTGVSAEITEMMK